MISISQNLGRARSLRVNEMENTAILRDAGLVFFLSREVPQSWVEFIIRSKGGEVGWEGKTSPFDAMNPDITHHIVDRPTQVKLDLL